MAPRRRSSAKRSWPTHLYERDGYYSWRHPLTREEFGLGRDRTAAFAQAIEANTHLAGLREKPRLIDRLTGSADRSVAKWAEKYAALLAQQAFAPATRKSYKSLSKRMVQMLGPSTPLRAVTALQVSEVLEKVAVTEGKPRLAQVLRNFMRDSFREARVHGWVDDNPVRDTRLSVKVVVKRARLTLEVFQQIYTATKLDWLRNAMALALVSGQRREDIALAQFRAFREGGWWCEQQSEKSTNPHRIFIPLDLRLEAFGMSLGEVLMQCRQTGALSPYLIHQTKRRGNSPVGNPIWIDTLSHRFAAAVEALGIDWGEKTAPSFHEIRSLSERLYSAQGGVNTQELLGHNDAATTATYHDSRGSGWVRIKTTV